MGAVVLSDSETCASVLQPYFDAAKDVFVEELEKRVLTGRSKLRRTELIVTEEAHDKPRHFAGTNETGSVVIAAPQMADLPDNVILAIFAHELGHAADFAYPASWTWPRARAGEVAYVGSDAESRAVAWRQTFGKAHRTSSTRFDHERPAINWTRAWEERSPDEVEWAADGIAFWVTGRRIGYEGPCMLQSLRSSARPRPKGLR